MKKILLIAGTLLLAALVIFNIRYHSFSSEKWNYVNNHNYFRGHPGRQLKREAIYMDLLDNYNLTGKTVLQVRGILGNPDAVTEHSGTTEWLYEIVTDYSGDGDMISGKDLIVEFERSGTILEVKKMSLEVWKRQE